MAAPLKITILFMSERVKYRSTFEIDNLKIYEITAKLETSFNESFNKNYKQLATNRMSMF